MSQRIDKSIAHDNPKTGSKKSQIIAMLERPEGISLTELEKATGWQSHSVRGALVHLKNRDKLPITNTVIEGIRCYHIVKTEA